VAHAFLLGGHGECSLRREQQRSLLEQLETIKLQGSAYRLTLTCRSECADRG
jgi:hypothetical protein